MEGIPQQRQAPSDLPEDFEDVLDNMMIQRKRSPGMFGSTQAQLEQMAQGEDADGAREYYPGWTDDHFKKLLEALKKN
jgi:hypothetical protein